MVEQDLQDGIAQFGSRSYTMSCSPAGTSTLADMTTIAVTASPVTTGTTNWLSRRT